MMSELFSLSSPEGIWMMIGLFYIISLVIWIYVCWRIGKRKGKVLLGILLGLFIGFIGLIIMLILPDDEKIVEMEKLQSGGYKKCPYCAEIVRAEAKVCKHCTKDL